MKDILELAANAILTKELFLSRGFVPKVDYFEKIRNRSIISNIERTIRMEEKKRIAKDGRRKKISLFRGRVKKIQRRKC